MHFLIREDRLRAPWRVALYILAYSLGYLIAPVPVIFLYAVCLLSTGQKIPNMGNLPLPIFIATGGAASLIILFITLLFCRFLDKGRLIDLGLEREAEWPKQIGLGLFLGVLIMCSVFTLELVGGWLRIHGYAWQDQSPSLTMATLVGYTLVYVFVAFNEELGFRGYILQNLGEEWGSPVALLTSSGIFALFHGLNPNINLLGFLGVGLAGVLLGYSYLVTGSLWMPIALHFAWNFAEGPLFSFPVSGLSRGGLLLVENRGPSLLTGGPFGPEGGLIGIVFTLFGILLVHLWSRMRRPSR